MNVELIVLARKVLLVAEQREQMTSFIPNDLPFLKRQEFEQAADRARDALQAAYARRMADLVLKEQ